MTPKVPYQMYFEDLSNKNSGPTPSARCNHGCVALGKYFFVVGGRGEGNEQRYNDVHILDIDKMEWRDVQAIGDLPPASSSFTLSVVGDSVYLFGGKTSDTFLNSMFSFKHRVLPPSPSSDRDTHVIEWREIKYLGESVPPPRYLHTACVVGKKIFMFGGSAPDDSCYNDLHIFNTRTCVWLKFRANGIPPTPRARHTACVSGNRMYVIGGMDSYGRNQSEMYALNIDSLTWEKVPIPENNIVPPVAGATTLQFGSKLVMFGGLSDLARPEGESTNETYVFDTLKLQWSRALIQVPNPTPAPPLPHPQPIPGVIGIPPVAATALPEVRNGHRGAVIPGTSRVLFFGGWHCRFLGDIFALETYICDTFQSSYQTTSFNKHAAFFTYDASRRRRFSIFDVEIVHKSELAQNIAKV